MQPQAPAPKTELTERLYRDFAQLVYDAAGISLGGAKQELVRSRLGKRLRALGLTGYEEYYEYLRHHDKDGRELVQMIDAISTNKTDFFRENQHFIFLRDKILPGFADAVRRDTNARRLRIWSAGCSSGEEPYTLAMVLLDSLAPDIRWDLKILATDISTRVLHFAHQGLYPESHVQPVPPQLRQRFFTKQKSPGGGNVYRVGPELRALITFRRLNLMRPEFPFSSNFQVIFCRNVMIYFDHETQERLVNKYYRYLAPGGYFFIGHSESLNSIRSPFKFVQPTIYRKPL